MNKLQEVLSPISAVAPQDIGTGDITGAYLPMAEANRMLAVVTTESLTAAKIVTIELLQATDDAGAGAKALASAVSGVAPVGNGPATAQVEIMGDEFDTNNGFNHFAVKVTCDEVGKLGSAVAIKGDLRYSN